MKIGIFGRHPVPQPGFMGVMSLFEAIYLSRLGHVVDLFLPFKTPAALEEFLRVHSLQSLDGLERFHGDFRVLPLFEGDELAAPYDVIIYQSYDAADHGIYFAPLRRGARILTKNFPKFVPGPRLALHETVESTFRSFDLVACALQDDVAELRANPEFWEKYGAKVAYVPRGADPTMLHGARKLGSRPTIGLEVPFTAGSTAADFYIEPLRRLQAVIPGLRILTLGSRPHPQITSEHIKYGRFDRIYDKFFNEIWLYLIMDYGLSPAHVAASVQKLHPADWSRRAIYEVQNIEAQMSGAVIIGHPDNIIGELVQLGASAFHVQDYARAPQIASLMQGVIANYPMLSLRTRQWAESGFSWEHCMALWADAMRRLLNSR